jgi:hypothetical protein
MPKFSPLSVPRASMTHLRVNPRGCGWGGGGGGGSGGGGGGGISVQRYKGFMVGCCPTVLAYSPNVFCPFSKMP